MAAHHTRGHDSGQVPPLGSPEAAGREHALHVFRRKCANKTNPNRMAKERTIRFHDFCVRQVRTYDPILRPSLSMHPCGWPACSLHGSASASLRVGGCSYGIVSDPRPVPSCHCHTFIRPSIHPFIHGALMHGTWGGITHQARHACQGPNERGRRSKCGSARAG
jgi:hypothetical protein